MYHFDTLDHQDNIEFRIPVIADSILREDISAPKDNILLDRVPYYYSNFAHLDSNGHLSDRTCVVEDTEPVLATE